MKLIERFCQRINLGPVISYREKLSRYAPAICAHAIGVIDGTDNPHRPHRVSPWQIRNSLSTTAKWVPRFPPTPVPDACTSRLPLRFEPKGPSPDGLAM
jgi:hypothetical protein